MVAVLAVQAIGVGLLATGALGTSKEGPQVAAKPQISSSTSVDHDVSPPLADLPAPSAATPPAPLELERQTPAIVSPQIHDPAVQTAVGSRNVPVAAGSFEGVRMADLSSQYVPPDTVGDVGQNQYVQAVNGGLAVFSKTGDNLTGAIDDSSFWSGLNGCTVSASRGLTDPTVNYDQFADRWVYAVLSFDVSSSTYGPSYMCVAVSTTGDATGTWNRYSFLAGNSPLGGVLPDYPKLGVWPDGYYLSFNDFDNAAPHYFVGAGAMVLDRASMLAGTPAQSVFLDLRGVSGLTGGMLPADADGANPPAANTPNYYVTPVDDPANVNDQLGVWAFQVNWSVPGNSTFTNPQALQVAAYNGQGHPVSQPGTGTQLDGLADDRLMNRNQYRNFGVYQTLVTNLTVDNGSGGDAPRWYELRKNAGSWAVNQQSTFQPTALNRWLGSAAMDGAGDIALGYSAGDGSTAAGLRYTGRVVGDALNTMQAEATLIAGGGSQTGTVRWGDYSQMTVDPTDDCTFWYTGEYNAVTAGADWHTRIGSFRFPSCVTAGGPTYTVAPAVSGTLLEGQTLTSTAGTWSPSPTTTAYQWRRCDANGVFCTDIPGATASTYVEQAADAGYRLRSNVTVTSGSGSSSVASAATGTVIPLPPVNSVPPTITGTAQVGQTLTANPGTWSTYTGAPNAFSYVWERCFNGCGVIPGATSSTYALGGADAGATVRVNVTATTIGGPNSAVSASTLPVALPAAPANVAPPSVTGTAQVGQILTGQIGTWTGVAPITYTYQWQTCAADGTNCSALGGQTGATYAVQAGNVGSALRLAVTASNSGGASSVNTAVTSAVVAVSSGGGGGGGGGALPDVMVSGFASKAAALPGEEVTFALTVIDKNGVMAQQLFLDVALPSGLQYVRSTTDRGSGCTPVNAAQVRCNLDFLSSSAPIAHIQITTKVVAAGQQTITASATAGQGELTPADNTVTIALNAAGASGAPVGLNGDGTPTKKQDKKAPTARALASAGKRGRAAQLRFKVYDDHGVAKVTTTVKRNGSLVGTASTGYGPVAYGSVYYIGWKVPARAGRGNYSFCVVAVDRAGNKSAQTCAPLALK